MSLKQPHEFFFAVTPERAAIFAVSLFFVFTIFYLFTRVVPFFFTPEIFIQNSPAVSKDESVVFEGRVTSASRLTQNGEEVYIGKNGFFVKDAHLREGVNHIVFTAHNRLGRSAEIVRRVVYIKN